MNSALSFDKHTLTHLQIQKAINKMININETELLIDIKCLNREII